MANAGIRFAQSAIDRFIQFKLIQLQERRQDERNRRFDLSLQQNRRASQEQAAAVESRFARTQAFQREQAVETKAFRTRTAERLEDTAESLERYREAQIGAMGDKKPFTEGRIQQTLGELESGGSTSLLGHVIPFRNREGYINHALRKLGPDWLEIAPEAADMINRKFPDLPPISAPRTFGPAATPILGGLFPRRTLEGETGETIGFETTGPTGPSIFRPRTPDTGAAISGGPITQDFLPPDPNEGIFDRLDTFESERVRVRDKEGKLFMLPRGQLEQALSEGYEQVDTEELAEPWQVP